MALQWPDELKEIENADKLARAEEEYHRQLSMLDQFEEVGSHWSDLGEWVDVDYEKLEPSYKEELEKGKQINVGGYGVVNEVEFRGLRLAQKVVKVGNFDKSQVKLIMDEGKITKRLGKHHHVIKLVGTYWKKFNPADWTDAELHILTFPVANCDLAHFLDDCEEVSAPSRRSLTDLPNALERLVAMGFHVSRSAEDLRNEIQGRLKEMMGCLTKAVEWCHSKKIQHRDLKPANILIRPGKILLADFGISRDRIASDRSNTEFLPGFTLGYAAPELLSGNVYNARHSDVYSIGCVFLHILSVVYGPNFKLEEAHPNRHYNREKQFRAYLQSMNAQRLKLKHTPQHPFLPAEAVLVLAPMFSENGDRRPDIPTIQNKLTAIGEPGQLYFGRCCRTYLQSSSQLDLLSPSSPLKASSSPTLNLRRVSANNFSTAKLKRFVSFGDNRPSSRNSQSNDSATTTDTWYRAMALYTCPASPDQPDHLGFTQGTILDVTDTKKTWWTARAADGSSGLVSGSFFSILHDERPSPSIDVGRAPSMISRKPLPGNVLPELDSGYDRAELA